ncbi:MAG: radical SAM protein [Endomicrobiia bacterium]
MKNFHIQWHITEICNFKCLHCYKEPYRKELYFEELKIIADRLNEFINTNRYTLTISFTGGEPFLKPEVYDIAEYVDKFSSTTKINFITNGSIIPDIFRLKNLSKLGIIYVSLESIDEKINDKIRGKGSFNIVFNNLYRLSNNFTVGIMTTLMNTNIEDLTENLDFFVEKLFLLGIKEIIFERFIPVGEAKKLKNEVVDLKKILRFYSKLAETFCVDFDELKKYPAIKLVNKERIFKFNNLEVYAAKCIFAEDGFAILCDGGVYPCRRFDFEIGNFLNEKNFYFNIDKLNLLKSKFIKNDEIFCCYATEKSLEN